MPDRVRDSDSRDVELRSLEALRAAVAAIGDELERSTAAAQHSGRCLDALLDELRRDALILSFDADGGLAALDGKFGERFGIDIGELESAFAAIAAADAQATVRRANEHVLSGKEDCVLDTARFRSAAMGSAEFELIHVVKRGADGTPSGVEVICRELIGGDVEGPEESGDTAFANLLMKTASRLLGGADSGPLRRALAAIGELFAVDRVVLNDFDDEARTFYVHESWRAPEVATAAAESRGISISELPWAYSLLSAGEAVPISEGADLPPEARSERRLYVNDDVRAALLVPLLRGATLTGFISLQSAAADRAFTDTEVAQARQFAAVVSSALTAAGAGRELEGVKREAAEAAEKLTAARTDAEEARAAARSSDEQLGVLKEEAAKARDRATRLEVEIEAARGALHDAERSAEEARNSREDARGSINDVREELEATKVELEELRRQLEAAKNEASRAQRRVEDTAADALRVRAELEETRGELAESRAELAEALVAADDAAPKTTAESGVAPKATTEDEAAPKATAVEAATTATAVEAATTATATETEDERASEDEARPEKPPAAAAPPPAPRWDPDATIEVRSPAFDPDATLEIEPAKRDTTPEGLPRARGLDEILQHTQSGAEEETETDLATDEQLVEEEADEAALPDFLDDVAGGSGPDDPAAEKKDDFWGFDAGGKVGEKTIPQMSRPPDELATGEIAAAVRGRAVRESPRDERDAWAPESQGDVAAPPVADDLEAARMAARQAAGKQEDEAVEAAASAGVSTDADRAPTPAPLPGLDTKAGIGEVGGNAELYRNLLNKFRQDYHGAADKISGAIGKGNVEIAHLLLHAIKGSAGVIGATRVRAAAEKLEDALVRRDSSTPEVIATFTAALQEVIDTIGKLQDGAELVIRSAEEEGDVHVSDPKVLRSYLEGLRQHLRGRKPKQCQLVMREVTARTWPEHLDGDVEKLAAAIGDDDFDTADELFANLTARLQR